MDALTHAIEAVVSKGGNPISEGLACKPIPHDPEQLPGVRDKPADLEPRCDAARVDHGGWAFSVGGVGLVHGMSHGSARATACRMDRERHLAAARDALQRRHRRGQLALVARALGVQAAGDDRALALLAAQAVADLLVRVRHQLRLSEVKCRRTTSQSAQRSRMKVGATSTNHAPCAAREIVQRVSRGVVAGAVVPCTTRARDTCTCSDT